MCGDRVFLRDSEYSYMVLHSMKSESNVDQNFDCVLAMGKSDEVKLIKVHSTYCTKFVLVHLLPSVCKVHALYASAMMYHSLIQVGKLSSFARYIG